MAHGNKLKFSTKEHRRPLKNEFAPNPAAFYDKKPKFSFTHYQHDHKDYSVKYIKEYKDFHTMFERLKAMSQFQWKDIIKSPQVFHFHPIEWAQTSEANGFRLSPAELNEVPAWQFKSFKECRIIGFFNNKSIFELIWIDRDHKVYPQK
jgi:hypothetical protein